MEIERRGMVSFKITLSQDEYVNLLELGIERQRDISELFADIVKFAVNLYLSKSEKKE